MNNPKIDELIKVLSEKGMSPEESAKVRDELLDQVYETFLSHVSSSLTDEDLQKIEASETQEAANEALKTVYKEKTGLDAEEEMKKVVDQKVDELIAKYKNDTQSDGLGNPSDNTPSETTEIHKAEEELHKLSEETAGSVPNDPQTNPSTEVHDPVKTADSTNWQ